MLEAPRHAPRLAGAHPRWRSTFTSTFHGFRVLSNSDRAPVFLFAFCTCSLPGPQALNQLAEACSFLQMECKVWAGPGRLGRANTCQRIARSEAGRCPGGPKPQRPYRCESRCGPGPGRAGRAPAQAPKKNGCFLGVTCQRPAV